MLLQEADIAKIVGMICDSTLGMYAKLSDVAPDESTPMIAACVHITGGWQGAVVLCAPEAFTRLAAAKMFATEASEASVNDMQDSLAELSNMIGGNFKGMLPLTDACHLSLPSVVAGGNYIARVPGSKLVQRVVIDVDGELLVVCVLVKQVGEARAAA